MRISDWSSDVCSSDLDYLMKTSPLAEILERVQYWSRRGALEDIDQRRERAIAQLEGIVAQMEDQARARAGLEATSDAASLDLLVEFVGSRADRKSTRLTSSH